MATMPLRFVPASCLTYSITFPSISGSDRVKWFSPRNFAPDVCFSESAARGKVPVATIAAARDTKKKENSALFEMVSAT